MSGLLDDFRKTMPPGMVIPPGMAELYDWIEKNRFIRTDGGRFGHLGDDCPTYVGFTARPKHHMQGWFGPEPTVLNRICVFCRVGSDGSECAFWLSGSGEQKIVIFGSGSGSTSLCILTCSFLDFLRLLAIGYEEISGGQDELEKIPEGRDAAARSRYRQWLCSTFSTTVPDRGSDLIVSFSDMMDEHPSDEFHLWVKARQSERDAKLLRQAIAHPIAILPAEPAAWLRSFDFELKHVKLLYRKRLVTIEHIGSTAVPGLAAEPIVDLLIGVSSTGAGDRLIAEMQKLYYTTTGAFNAALPDGRWLMRHRDGRRTHHVHVIPVKSPSYQGCLAFRERLRNDARMAGEYAALKRDLASRHHDDREAYNAGKAGFIERYSRV